MKEQWEQECAALRAEVVALQHQVRALAAPQASAKPLARWRVSKSMRFGVLTVCVLLAAGGVLYGEGAMEALSIDKDGKVGIGTTTPSAKFEVSLVNPNGWSGNLRGLRLLSPDPNYALDVSAHVIEGGNVGYHFSPNNHLGLEITTPGHVGIGTMKPTHKFHVVAEDAVGLFESSGTQAFLRLQTNEGSENRVEITNRPGGRLSLWTRGGGDVFNITKDGKVGIGRTNPDESLDVQGNALLRGDLNLGNSALYFTKTDHHWSAATDAKVGRAAIENSDNYNALMIAGRTTESTGRIVSVWDRLGIGRSDPKTALDVKGEIRGKLWTSQEYEWSQGETAKTMTKSGRSVCFLTYVTGEFAGGGEAVEIKEQGDYWVLTGQSGRGRKDVRARARCIGAPDDSW